MAAPVEAARPVDLSLSDEELERVREHITGFIRDQTDAAGVEDVVIGLSGGIDSTLTSHLAVEALGREAVYGLVMPSEVNRAENMSDAERVAADLLEVEYDVVAVEPVVDELLAVTPGVGPGPHTEDPLKTAVGNARARIRAVYSYFAANRRGAMVLGTGNRSEAMVGYFTKYGDGAVDCHPIGNLYKAQVRQLAGHLGVPDDLVEKPASAELWADQTDAGELGLSYDTLDSILALHIDGRLAPAATARAIGVDESLVDEVRAMYEASAHKREAPPGPESLY
jgi:NAD+ synthase